MEGPFVFPEREEENSSGVEGEIFSAPWLHDEAESEEPMAYAEAEQDPWAYGRRESEEPTPEMRDEALAEALLGEFEDEEPMGESESSENEEPEAEAEPEMWMYQEASSAGQEEQEEGESPFVWESEEQEEENPPDQSKATSAALKKAIKELTSRVGASNKKSMLERRAVEHLLISALVRAGMSTPEAIADFVLRARAPKQWKSRPDPSNGDRFGQWQSLVGAAKQSLGALRGSGSASRADAEASEYETGKTTGTVTIEVVERTRSNQPVVGATVQLLSPAEWAGKAIVKPSETVLRGTTNKFGKLIFNLKEKGKEVAEGKYTLEVTPNIPKAVEPVGPDLGGANVTTSIYRPLSIEVSVKNGSINKKNTLQVQLQPLWIRSPIQSSRKGEKFCLIVLHHTGGLELGPAINTFLNEKASSHYIIDRDGEIIKMVHEDQQAGHAGYSIWDGRSAADGTINPFSIGIEMVNDNNHVFTDKQYEALIPLIKRIREKYKDIPPYGIVGHADVGTTNGILGRKPDPNETFDWPRLEKLGLGLVPVPDYLAKLLRLSTFWDTPLLYDGYFDAKGSKALTMGDYDYDAGKKPTVKYGTKDWSDWNTPGRPARVIKLVQDDLSYIGYACSTGGVYDDKMAGAVDRFQFHFISGSRKGTNERTGAVDRRTAVMIKRVCLGLLLMGKPRPKK